MEFEPGIFQFYSERLNPLGQLGPLLFNNYLNDLFFALKDIEVCNFAYGFAYKFALTPFVLYLDLNTTLNKLSENSATALLVYMKLHEPE